MRKHEPTYQLLVSHTRHWNTTPGQNCNKWERVYHRHTYTHARARARTHTHTHTPRGWGRGWNSALRRCGPSIRSAVWNIQKYRVWLTIKLQVNCIQSKFVFVIVFNFCCRYWLQVCQKAYEFTRFQWLWPIMAVLFDGSSVVFV